MEYLIKWKGYEDKDNTWEPAANLNPDLIQRYQTSIADPVITTPDGHLNVMNFHLQPTDHDIHDDIGTIASISSSMPTYSRPHPDASNGLHTNSCIHFYKVTQLLLILCLFPAGQAFNLGTLYDCTVTKPLGVYQMPTLPDCSQKPHTNRTTGPAWVYRYSPNATKFFIYWCSYTHIKLRCDFSNPFAGKNNHRSTQTKSVSSQTCIDALRSKRFSTDSRDPYPYLWYNHNHRTGGRSLQKSILADLD